jgi:hypothetical protein
VVDIYGCTLNMVETLAKSAEPSAKKLILVSGAVLNGTYVYQNSVGPITEPRGTREQDTMHSGICSFLRYNMNYVHPYDKHCPRPLHSIAYK